MATRASAVPTRKGLTVFTDLRKEIVEDRVTGLAAEVAFFAVLSIFPGMLMVAAALGNLELLVGGELATRSQAEIVRFLDLILTDEASGALGEVEALFEEGRPGILTAASVGALLALSRGFSAVIRALNLAHDTGEKRPWLRQRLLALGFALGSVVGASVTMTMVVLGPFLGGGDRLAGSLGIEDAFDTAWSWVRWPVAFLVMVTGAAILLHVAPCRERARWTADLPGAALTAILWLVVSLGFSAYLRLAPGANAVLGALGGGLILLVWLYLLSLSLLVGGELNALLNRHEVTET